MEAAVVLPLFIFSVLAFVYLFQIMELQLKLQSALNRTAEQTASYGYLLGRVLAVTEDRAEEVLERSGLFSEEGLLSVDEAGEWMMELLSSAAGGTVFGQITELYMREDDPAVRRIVNGWDGIEFNGSCLKDDTSCVVIKAKYRVRIPFVPEVLSEIEFCQSAVCRVFCGDRAYVPIDRESEESEEPVYFVTPNGTVYHRSRNCSYLTITLLTTDCDEIANMRNDSGGKYYPCERCTEGIDFSGQVYYTRSGSRYHTRENCSSLTRTIMEVSEETVTGLPPCSRCGQEE